MFPICWYEDSGGGGCFMETSWAGVGGSAYVIEKTEVGGGFETGVYVMDGPESEAGLFGVSGSIVVAHVGPAGQDICLEHEAFFQDASGEYLAVFDDGVGPEAVRGREVADDTRNAFMLLVECFFYGVYLINAEFVDGSFIEEERNDEEGYRDTHYRD